MMHKLNTDFFSLETSCATVWYRTLSTSHTWPHSYPWAQYAAIYSSISIEILIPTLLLTRRFRNLGILIGLIFHSLLSFSHLGKFYNFGAMLFALYFLFAPPTFVPRVWDLGKRLTEVKWWNLRLIGLFRIFLISSLICVAASLLLIDRPYRRELLNSLLRGSWFLYAAGCIALFLIIGRKERFQAMPTKQLLKPSLMCLPILLFVLFNGSCPYIGLKTETSFSMFSNLHTEGGYTNHFFIPAYLKVAHYQEDLVHILESSDPKLQRYAETGLLMTAFELRSYLSKKPKTTLTIIRNGTKQRIQNPNIAPDLFKPLPKWLRKALVFRPVNPAPPKECTH